MVASSDQINAANMAEYEISEHISALHLDWVALEYFPEFRRFLMNKIVNVAIIPQNVQKVWVAQEPRCCPLKEYRDNFMSRGNRLVKHHLDT
jgi:hypothetical protein